MMIITCPDNTVTQERLPSVYVFVGYLGVHFKVVVGLSSASGSGIIVNANYLTII